MFSLVNLFILSIGFSVSNKKRIQLPDVTHGNHRQFKEIRGQPSIKQGNLLNTTTHLQSSCPENNAGMTKFYKLAH